MARYFAGVVSALLLAVAVFFIWRSQAGSQAMVPPAPESNAAMTPLKPGERAAPPAASEKTREEKRFARADLDDDGRIAREELMTPRRKAFARLDKDKNGSLSLEEWAVRTVDKFAAADADRSGWLTAAEFETTRPKRPSRPRCDC
jgi:hypothetical protein